MFCFFVGLLFPWMYGMIIVYLYCLPVISIFCLILDTDSILICFEYVFPPLICLPHLWWWSVPTVSWQLTVVFLWWAEQVLVCVCVCVCIGGRWFIYRYFYAAVLYVLDFHVREVFVFPVSSSWVNRMVSVAFGVLGWPLRFVLYSIARICVLLVTPFFPHFLFLLKVQLSIIKKQELCREYVF